MSAKDAYHNVVKVALIKDGWMITHDPLTLEFANRQKIRIDLGASLVAAQKGEHLIAVEIKSFLAPSWLSEFHTALGQFLNYRVGLQVKEPERVLYLAVPLEVYEDFFFEDLPQLSMQAYELKIIVFDPANEEIVQWIS